MLAHKNHSETFLITRHTLKRLQQLPCSQHPWLGSKKIKEKSGKQCLSSFKALFPFQTMQI